MYISTVSYDNQINQFFHVCNGLAPAERLGLTFLGKAGSIYCAKKT